MPLEGGAITVGERSALRVDVVDVSELPSAGVRVYPLSLTSGAILDGAFYGSAGIRNGAVSVTVNGEASTAKLVYVPGGDSGLYKAVARCGDNYYATFQSALDARSGGSATGDVMVLDATAPIPAGYKVVDTPSGAKLVHDYKAIIMVF